MIEPNNPTTEEKGLARPWAFWLLFFFQYAAIAVYFTYLNVYYRDAGLTGTQIGVINMASSLMSVLSAVFWGNLSDRTGKPRIFIAGGALGALFVAQFVPAVSTFQGFLVLALAGSALGSAPSTLADSTTLAWLGDRREDYARYRLGGTFGYILTGTLIGFVLDRMGLRLMFPAYGVTMAMFAILALFLPDLPVRMEAKSWGIIAVMVRQKAWIIMVASLFLVWIASNASIMFMGVVLNSMGATQGLIGIASTVGAVVEIPFMMGSPWLLRRFGPARLLVIALAIMILRYSLLAWMPVPELAVPINALNGPAFVLFWNSAINLANRMAPPGLAGTAQGLISSVMNLSSMASALLTGILFDRLGSHGMFFVMALCVTAAFLLFSIANLRSLRGPSAVQPVRQ